MQVIKTQVNTNFRCASMPSQQQCFRSSAVHNVTVERSEEKKSNHYTTAALIAISGLALGGIAVISRRTKIKKAPELSENLKNIQRNISDIFEREYSNEETVDFVNRYKNVVNADYSKEYYLKLFSELKKDYKFENKNLKLEFLDAPAMNPNSRNKMVMYTEALSRHIGVFDYNEITPKHAFAGLFHEGKHVKQFETMYRTDKNRLITIKVNELETSNNASYRMILRDFGGDKVKARKYIRSIVEQKFSEMYSHLTPLKKDSLEYKNGLKYLDNEANRISGHTHSLEEYKAQILEKEAYEIEDKAEELYELLKKRV